MYLYILICYIYIYMYYRYTDAYTYTFICIFKYVYQAPLSGVDWIWVRDFDTAVSFAPLEEGSPSES